MAEHEKLAVLNGLAGNYAATLAPETAKMWLFLLREYTVQQTQEAALCVIRKYGTETVPYRTMPPFALMQRELDILTGTVRGEENVLLQARAEWGKLLELMKRCGIWREPELNRTTAYCVRSFGGWERVCRWKLEELAWREREFIQLWQQCSGKEDVLALGGGAVQGLTAPGGLAALRLRALKAALPCPGAQNGHSAPQTSFSPEVKREKGTRKTASAAEAGDGLPVGTPDGEAE